MFPFCVERKISIIARVPFDEGALTENVGPSTNFPAGDFRNDYFKGKRKLDVKLRAAEIWEDVKDEVETLAEAGTQIYYKF